MSNKQLGESPDKNTTTKNLSADQEVDDGPIVPFDPERYVGIVTHVNASSLEFIFDNASQSSGESNRSGTLASLAEVGANMVIAVKHFGIIGRLTSIYTPSAGHHSTVLGHPMGAIHFSHTLDGTSGKIFPGVPTMPRVGSKVYIAPPKLVQAAVESNTKNDDGSDPIAISFATLSDKLRTRLRFTPEMMFGRHCAVLGTTGGGKSWTLAKIVEETGKLRSKVILFDATGEFGTLRDGTHHVFLGQHPNPSDLMREVAVPYYELMEKDLFAIFKPRGQSQGPKLRSAIKSLKLARLAAEIALDGTIMKANRSKKEFQQLYKQHYSVVEDERAIFEVQNLARQVEHECVRPNRSEMEPQFWGDISPVDQSHCVPLVNRIRDIVGSPNLAPIFQPQGKPSLLRVIDAFIDDPDGRVLCVSLQYLSFAHHAREIVTNAIGRHLMRMAQNEKFRKKPLLVVVDEAHQFLNKALTEVEDEFPLDAFSLIAKEGRKYALTLCMATQRPRDLPESVLSQMGTLVVHRLINDKDRAVVEFASGEIDRSALDSLPSLAPGQAIVVGAAFPMPLLVQVTAPECPPFSRGPNYQKFWNF